MRHDGGDVSKYVAKAKDKSGRNQYNSYKLEEIGFEYYQIGK